MSFDDPVVHRIRLRGPWTFEWITGPAGSPREGSLTLPATWDDALGSATGAVRISRRFGRQAEPDEEDRVWLEIACPGTRLAAVLNGEQIGASDDGVLRVEVTGKLAARNRLDLDLSRGDPGDATIAEVALVFESPF